MTKPNICKSCGGKHDIEEYEGVLHRRLVEPGWGMVHIVPEDGSPSYSYSFGLWISTAHPEVIMFSVAPKLANDFIDHIGEKAKKFPGCGTYRAGTVLKRAEGTDYSTAFIDAHEESVRDYMGIARHLYGNRPDDPNAFPTLQVIWSDKKKLFPWDEGFDKEYRDQLPILGRLPDPPETKETPVKIAWATDTHLNFLTKYDREPFFAAIRAASPDLLLLTGDISTGAKIVNDLTELKALAPRVAFVLGNHDYYHSSIGTVRTDVVNLCKAHPSLIWLSESMPVPLSETAALVGHDGWADAGAGDLLGDFDINDFYQIGDLNTFDKTERFRRMRVLADESVQTLTQTLSEALRGHSTVYLATHVPPYVDASRHEGNPSDPEALPYFCNVRLGVMIDRVMSEHPDKKLVVLCGHTHSAAYVQRDNITILAGQARYRAPIIQLVFQAGDIPRSPLISGHDLR